MANVFDRLNQDVEALLSGSEPEPHPAGSELAALLGVAADLRGLPRPSFRDRLGAGLAGSRSGAREGGAMTTRVAPVREGFHTVTPYLVVREAEGLLEFVKAVFGATELLCSTGSAGGLHAEVRIGDSIVMLGGSPEMPFEERPTSLHLYVEDADEVYRRALAAGAATLDPPEDRDYGDRDASVRDPFGNEWYIGTHLGPSGPVPEGLRSVNLYLHPVGAAGLIDFLQRAFGAAVTARHESPEGTVRHARVRIGDSIVEMGEAHGKYGPMPGMVYLYVEDVDALHARAVAEGARSVQEPADQPYGDRTAHVQDPAGNSWYIATHVRDVPVRP